MQPIPQEPSGFVEVLKAAAPALIGVLGGLVGVWLGFRQARLTRREERQEMALSALRSKLTEVSLASTLIRDGMQMEGEDAPPPPVLGALVELLATRQSEYEAEWKRRWLSSVFDPDALFLHNRLTLAQAKLGEVTRAQDREDFASQLKEVRSAARLLMEYMEKQMIWPRPWRRTIRALKKDERVVARHDRFEKEWAEVRKEVLPYETFSGVRNPEDLVSATRARQYLLTRRRPAAHLGFDSGGARPGVRSLLQPMSSLHKTVNDLAASPGRGLRFGAVGRTLEQRAGALFLEGGHR